MNLHYIYTGNPKKRRYFIQTNDEKPIASFDSFETAAVVLRYLKGSNLSPEERAAAHEAMKEFDARGDKE